MGHLIVGPTAPCRVDRLVVAPHADDEALGCGGLLAKFAQTAAVVVLTRPDAVREVECRSAQAVLGYPSLFVLDFEDGFLSHQMHALVAELDVILTMCRPKELYLPFPSLHQDHVAGYEAGMRSARLSMSDGHYYPPNVLVYDVAAYDVSLYPSDLRWNVFEALDECHIDKKARAVGLYASQRVTGPHPANGLKQIAEALGVMRQVPYAEQFALVRQVRMQGEDPPTEQPARVRPTVVPRQTARLNGRALAQPRVTE